MNIKKVIENDFEEKLYISKIDEVLNYLHTFSSATFFEIVRRVGGSERRMLRLLDEMVNDGAIYFKNNKFYLSTISNYKSYLCPICNGKRVYTNEYDVSQLEEIFNNKPVPTLLFDQRPVTLETTINRVLYMLSNNDVNNKNIVFLGDDDLTSLALAFYDKSISITVLDVDKRLIDYINKMSKKYELNIKAYTFDVTDTLKDEFRGKFDVVMTDPTPEALPFTIFMNTCINLLKKEGIIYTSIYSSAMEKDITLQRIITDMNLYITDIIPNFTEYQSLKGLFSKSDLELLKKYNITINSKSICFTESLFRMIKSRDTHTIKVSYKLEDIYGKAQKRAIKDKKNDLVTSDYLTSVYEIYNIKDDKIRISE